jgi:hypothetical protein
VTVANVPPESELVVQRLAALLMTAREWSGNYTVSVDVAKWVVAEAARLGWEVTVGTFPTFGQGGKKP